jgi:hypothetical protein
MEGPGMGQRCPGCGWSLATTFTPPILGDEREHVVSLLPGNDVSPNVLKAVSRLMGCNYIAAKRLILEAPLDILVGRAPGVLEKRLTLESAGGADWRFSRASLWPGRKAAAR